MQKAKLDDQDAKLAAFQQKYFGMLPEQEPSNMNALQALTAQLDAATQSLNRSQQEVTFLQSMVTQQTHEYRTLSPTAPALQSMIAGRSLKACLSKSRHWWPSKRLTTPM